MKFNELFEYNGGLLINKKTGHVYCNLDKDGYIRVRVSDKEYRAHRIIWEMFNGPIPEGVLVDHEDRNPLNNVISNLRLATRQQNNHNSGATKGRLLPKGVSVNGNNYRARIYNNGKYHGLGTYDTVEKAEEAYIKAEKELRGDYART